MKLNTIYNATQKALQDKTSQSHLVRIHDSKISFYGFTFALEIEPEGFIYNGRPVDVPFQQLAKFYDAKGRIEGQWPEDGKITFKSQKTSLSLPWYETDRDQIDFHGKMEIETSWPVTIKSLENVAKYANKEQNRYGLDVVRMDFINQALVSTDQVCLRYQKFDNEAPSSLSELTFKTSIIPLLKALGEPDRMQSNEHSIVFTGDRYKLIVDRAFPQLPNYIGAIERYDSLGGDYLTDKESMLSILKDVELVACQDSKHMTFDGHCFSLKSSLGEIKSGEFGEEIETPVGLNQYLVETFCKQLDKGQAFSFQIIGHRKPIILRDGDNILFMSPVAI